MDLTSIAELAKVILGTPTALVTAVLVGFFLNKWVIKKSDFDKHVKEDSDRFGKLDDTLTEVKEGVAFIKGKYAGRKRAKA